MLIGQILNSDASINSFYQLSALEFIPGEQIKLVLRLAQSQRSDKLRYIVTDPAGEVNIFLPKTDGTDEELAMTAFASDRSIWYVDISETLSEELASGNFTFEVDELGDASQITKGWVQNGLSLVITGGDC